MMSTDYDKAFEDQIERMKQKELQILEKFQASEEDRRLAESSGSTIRNDQNVQLRVTNQPILRRKIKASKERPKSYGNGSNEDDIIKSFQNFNDNYKRGKYYNNLNDEEACKDYLHFQKSQISKSYSKNKRFNNRPNNTDRFKYNGKSFENDQNDFYRNKSGFSNVRSAKDNKSGKGYSTSKNNSTLTKSYIEHNNNNVNSNNQKRREKNINANNIYKNNQYTDAKNNSIGGSHRQLDEIHHKVSCLDDEYIDDTLEDLEKYRLKVDMDDFTVENPLYEDPILSRPLQPWSRDDSDLLNTVNERAKDYLNLGNPSHILGGSVFSDIEEPFKHENDNRESKDNITMPNEILNVSENKNESTSKLNDVFEHLSISTLNTNNKDENIFSTNNVANGN